MSVDGLTLRLTGDPGAMTVEAFAAAALAALGPVLRPIAKATFVAPAPTCADHPRLASALTEVPIAAVPAGHAIPCALPAAIFCPQLGAAEPAEWFTHLLWPGPYGQAAIPVASMVLDYQPRFAMVELTLMVQGLPLADVEFIRVANAPQPDWRVTPRIGRSAESRDWDRWAAALDALNVAMGGFGDRLWDVESCGNFATGDAQRFIALGQRLKRPIDGA